VEGRPVDLGASYLTVRDPGFRAVADDWLSRGLLRPWTEAFHVASPAGLRERKAGPLRYGTPQGLRGLVHDLLTGLDVRSSRTVGHVGPGPHMDGQPYDAVVLALPDPQALPLLDGALTAERATVQDRAWEPVLAVAAGFADRTWDSSFDGCFVDGSEVLAWVADDGRRRGDAAPVLVAHSTSAYAAGHLEDPEAATPALVAAAVEVLEVREQPLWSRAQRWTYARPAAARDVAFHLGPERVGLCGDGWGSPRVETAWVSGTQLGQALAAQL
jgi:predicted NAD/FAD-dependent oxidoreductase